MAEGRSVGRARLVRATRRRNGSTAGGGWRVAGGGWRVAGGGWRVAGGGWRVAGGGWRVAGGGWRVAGTKPFCSGYGIIDRALVTAGTSEGYRLFDLDIANQVVGVHAGSWPAVGIAESHSETLDFGGPPVPTELAVGGPGFYLDRPGFWFGAVGVAACWHGGARGLVTHLATTLSPDTSEPVQTTLGQGCGAPWCDAQRAHGDSGRHRSRPTRPVESGQSTGADHPIRCRPRGHPHLGTHCGCGWGPSTLSRPGSSPTGS
jgi:hypothetical protein